MTASPETLRRSRLEAALARARERPVPWDETRARRVATQLTRSRTPLATGLRGFAWAGIASLALLAVYLPAARGILRGPSEASPVSAQSGSAYGADDGVDSESRSLLGDGGLEASADSGSF